MLHELERGEFGIILPLFQGYLQDPMMHAVIEGKLSGRIWVDDATHPTAAFIWTGAECAPRKSKQGGTKNRGQRRLRQPPFGDKRRRDVADSGRIKSIQEDDEKTQCKNEPLKARKSMRVQKFLDVNPPLNSHISTLPILIVTGTSVSL